jgi:cytochrome c
VRLRAGLGLIGASVVVALTVGAVLAITPQQVDRGELAYAQHCAFCHGPNGDDGFAPPLTGLGSLSSFGTVRQFYDFVRTAMPQTAPGSLPMQTYLDIVAFELAQRGVATDGSELSLATLDATPLNPAPSTPAPTAR